MTPEQIKAAQQALEALKHGVAQLNGIGIPLEADPLHTAIAALESALNQRPAAQTEQEAPYGYCPECGAPGVTRERRPDGDDKCSNGHRYPSRSAHQQTAPVQAVDESMRNEKPAAYLYDITVDGVVCKDWCISASDWHDMAKAGVSNIRALCHIPRSVFIAGNETAMCAFASRDLADRYVSNFGGATAGGMTVVEVPVVGATPESAGETDGSVSVPLQVLKDASEALGNFVSDQGWSDSDMQAMDNLDAFIAQHDAQAKGNRA